MSFCFYKLIASLLPLSAFTCVGYGTYVNDSDPRIIIGIGFNNIGSTDGLLLNDLKGEFVDDDDIQFSFNEKGKTKLGDYFYYTEEYGLGDAGWYNEDFEYIGDSQYLTWGQGVWFIGADGPKNITTAGEVLKGHKIHTMTDPRTLVSSAYPVAFCPNAATVSWPNAQDDDDIQVAYTLNGKTKLKDYFYYTEEYGLGDAGWYNEDFEILDADFAIAEAGQGFWYCPVDFTVSSFAEVSPLGDVEAK